jgi:hypothetical protein
MVLDPTRLESQVASASNTTLVLLYSFLCFSSIHVYE